MIQKKLVNDYLGTGNLGVKEAVLKFQNDVRDEKRNKKHRSEIEAIDAVMNVVPELPKDFDNWIIESAFIHERYLIYHYGDKENAAYCTHCGKEVKLKITPRHNKNGICPSCRTNALMKSWNKQKYLQDKKNVGIIQKLTDGSGYILRRFRCLLKRTLEKDWGLEVAGCWENERFKLDGYFRQVEFFEYGEFRNTGVERWCHELNHGGYYGYYGTSVNECILYYRNLKNLRKGTDLQYIPIEELWRNNQGAYCTPLNVLSNLRSCPQIEYLLKVKLYRLSWDLATKYWRNDKEVDWEKKKPWQFLKVTKEQLSQCIRMNITKRQLAVLHEANEFGIKLSDDQIRFFTEEIGPDLIGEILQYGHAEKFQRYLTKQLLEEKKNRIGDYMDYLEDLKKLRVPITMDVLFPKHFQQTHQRYALQRQEQEDRLKKMEITEKDKLLQEMLPDLKEIYSMEDDNFLVILPTCKEDFNREGRENHNCVGGSYFDKMLEGKSCVMFLRKKEEPDKAFCTVEMQGSRILQNRAVRNSEPPQEAKIFMEKFSKEVEKRIRKKERERIRLLAV